jgi:type IV fimbrial biogenesis protein FimT
MRAPAEKGFSTIEIIIAMSVVAILLSISSPQFATLNMNKRISTQTNEFIASLALARSQALARISRVTVCSSANGTSCATSGNWDQGWLVFVDTNNNAQVDSGQNPPEDILQAHRELEGGNTLNGTSNVDQYISFSATGTARLTSGAFQTGMLVLCDDRGPGSYARAINISVTGRSRVETTSPDSCSP